jgi:hypothetical protein
MKRMLFTFAEEPRGAVYDRLLEVGLTESERLGLIVQKFRSYPTSMEKVLDTLSPYLIEMNDVSEWPGTRLVGGHTVELRLYRFEPPVKDLLQFIVNGLFDWENPELPDDPHLLRADGSTWLGCIAHEEDAWLELTTMEFVELQEKASDLAATLRPDS